MKWVNQLLLGLLLLCPLGTAVVLPLFPLPTRLTDASQTVRTAMLSNENQKESDALSVILAYSPWRTDLWKCQGRLQLNNEKYSDAVTSLMKVKTSGNLDTEGTLWLADALISDGQTEQAKEQLREVSSSQNVDALVFLQVALLQRRIGDTYGALATLLQAYQVAPLNSEINYQLGLQLSASEPESAVKFLMDAAQLNSERKAVCQSLLAMIEESKEIENSAERFIYIGQVLSTYSEWDVAQRAFENATAIDPENAIAWALLAESAQQNGQDGWKFLEKAQQLDDSAEIVNGISALYFRRQGKTDLAITYLQRALAANPEAATWEIEIGNIYANRGDLAEALTHYQAAVEINQQDWVSLKALASFCITYNYQLEEEGLPAARQALALYPDSSVLMDLLGAGFLMAEDYDSAERFFLLANQTDPNQSAILIHLGQVYLAQGENEVAFTYLRQAAAYAQNTRLREMAERLITENGGDL